MEKTQKENLGVNISWFLKKFILYFGLLYNVVWGAIFGILIYKRNESDNCEEVIKWGIGCFSFCIINPVKTYLLNLTEKLCEINQYFVFLVGIITSCAISIIFVVGLSIIDSNKSTDVCKSISGFQNIFFITESINIVFFCIILSYIVIKKHRDNNLEGDGMISIKTID
jgi:hypothetical protein